MYIDYTEATEHISGYLRECGYDIIELEVFCNTDGQMLEIQCDTSSLLDPLHLVTDQTDNSYGDDIEYHMQLDENIVLEKVYGSSVIGFECQENGFVVVLSEEVNVKTKSKKEMS